MPTPGQEISSLDFAAMIGGPLVAMVNAQKQAALTTVNFINEVGFQADPNNPDARKPIYVSFSYQKEIAPYVAPGRITGTTGTATTTAVGGAGFNGTVDLIISPPASGLAATATATVVAGLITAVTITSPGAGYPTTEPAPTFTRSSTAGSGPVTGLAAVLSIATPAAYETMVLQVPMLAIVPIPNFQIERGEIDFNCKINNLEYMDTASSFKIGGDLSFQAGGKRASVKLNVSASYQKSSNSGAKTERTYSMAVKVVASQAEIPAGLDRILGILEDATRSAPKTATTTA
jgi:hypothetical protein